MKKIYIIIIFIFFFSCSQKRKEKGSVVGLLEFVSEKKDEQNLLNETSDLSQNLDKNEKECPCKMPKIEDRYGILTYKGSLTDNQEKLVIKLCENEEGLYAISIESWNGWEEEKNIPRRGKIYDYKILRIEDKYTDFGEICTLQENGEYLYRIFTSKGIHSIWRVKEGKLIEMDKDKEYDCVEDADMG